MSNVRRSIFGLVGAWGLAGSASPTDAQQVCWPILSVKQPRLSDTMINMKRYWSATLEVNAVSCIESAGTFDLHIMRSKENAREFTFTEPVVWNTRQTDIVIELWADEAVLDYRVGRSLPCTCRY